MTKSVEMYELEIINDILRIAAQENDKSEYEIALKRKTELMKILTERKEILTIDEFWQKFT